MSSFISEFFAKEIILGETLETLFDILPVAHEDYINAISKNYECEGESVQALAAQIEKNFEKKLMEMEPSEQQAFYDFYNGAVDYTDENLYINLKKFSHMGWIYLFEKKGGKYYEFIIPAELLTIFEDMLKRS